VKGGLTIGFEFGHTLSVLQAAGVVIDTISNVDNTFAFSNNYFSRIRESENYSCKEEYCLE
jgi:hypothetical protein